MLDVAYDPRDVVVPFSPVRPHFIVFKLLDEICSCGVEAFLCGRGEEVNDQRPSRIIRLLDICVARTEETLVVLEKTEAAAR